MAKRHVLDRQKRGYDLFGYEPEIRFIMFQHGFIPRENQAISIRTNIGYGHRTQLRPGLMGAIRDVSTTKP